MEIAMNLNTVLAIAIAAAFAAPVAAQTSPGSDKPTGAQSSGTSAEGPAAGATVSGEFAGMDKNNDGYISRDEAKDATWSNRFSELDKDNDGRLSQSEFDAMQGAAGATGAAPGTSPSTTGGMGDKPGQKQ
jgi:hypothetical protein